MARLIHIPNNPLYVYICIEMQWLKEPFDEDLDLALDYARNKGIEAIIYKRIGESSYYDSVVMVDSDGKVFLPVGENEVENETNETTDRGG